MDDDCLLSLFQSFDTFRTMTYEYIGASIQRFELRSPGRAKNCTLNHFVARAVIIMQIPIMQFESYPQEE